ncbi:MAG: glycine zipper 2TM domain-containing protein [Rhodanobacter sp.]
MNALTGKMALAVAMTAGLGLAGCVTQPYGNNGYSRSQPSGYANRPARCQMCGVVQEVQQVYVQGGGNGGTLGAIIGAVAGGVLGSTVGKGDGRKAATVAGAVAGGVVGNQVGKRNGGEDSAWRITVRLDDGRYATVTQRENPGLRRGDYAEVRGDHVYPR